MEPEQILQEFVDLIKAQIHIRAQPEADVGPRQFPRGLRRYLEPPRHVEPIRSTARNTCLLPSLWRFCHGGDFNVFGIREDGGLGDAESTRSFRCCFIGAANINKGFSGDFGRHPYAGVSNGDGAVREINVQIDQSSFPQRPDRIDGILHEFPNGDPA